MTSFAALRSLSGPCRRAASSPLRPLPPSVLLRSGGDRIGEDALRLDEHQLPPQGLCRRACEIRVVTGECGAQRPFEPLIRSRQTLELRAALLLVQRRTG